MTSNAACMLLIQILPMEITTTQILCHPNLLQLYLQYVKDGNQCNQARLEAALSGLIVAKRFENDGFRMIELYKQGKSLNNRWKWKVPIGYLFKLNVFITEFKNPCGRFFLEFTRKK